MPINITVDMFVNYAVGPQEQQVMRVKKYNFLVNAFNGSTVGLVAALVAAVFFAYSAALVLGSIALFVRMTAEKELRAYAIPPEGAPAEQQHAAQVMQLAMNALGMGRRPAGNAILERLGAGNIQNWEACEVIVFDYPVWMNKAPEPEEGGRRRRNNVVFAGNG